jgi:hypothetical protein
LRVRVLPGGVEEQYDIESGEMIAQYPSRAPGILYSIAWHPSQLALAYAGDDKNATGQPVFTVLMPFKS